MRKILLSLIIILLVSVAFAGDFTRDDTAEIVTDSTNSLMWQDNAVVASAKYNRSDAINYCANLDFAGYSDWRLPTINEYLSIADYSRYDPAVVSTFLNTAASYYWSSTPFAPLPDAAAWAVDFRDGFVKISTVGLTYYVRCVR